MHPKTPKWYLPFEKYILGTEINEERLIKKNKIHNFLSKRKYK